MNKLYAEYSRVETRWMDSVPSHWSVLRLRRVLKDRKERNDPIQTDFILSLTAKQGVVPYADKEGAGGNKPKDDMTKYNLARANDLLVNCMNVVAGSAGVSKWDGAISPVYYALYPRDESINIWYYHYIFRLLTFQRSLIGLGKGILMHESSTGALNTVRMRISMDYLNSVLLPIPPREEQDQIVRYLNWQLSKVNKLIMSLKKQIALLNEKKESAVSYYVTHGLHTNNFKKSEIYWLTGVPENWRVTKLKHILQKEKRSTPDDAELLICSNSGEVKKRGNSKIGLVASSHDVYQGVAIGDLLIHGMDTWHGAIAISQYDGMCTPVVHVCTCKESKRFVAYYLKMMAYTKVFKAISNGVRKNTSDFRSWDKVGDLLIALPSVDEQEKISDIIENKLIKIDLIIEKYSTQIDHLHELRNRLISDVVTGQIDVRDVEVPDFEYIPDEAEDASDDDNSDVGEAEEEEI